VERSAVRDISRGSLYLGLEQITQVLFGTLYSMAILRLLGPPLYGILALGLAVAGLAGIATLNLETYLERFVAEIHGSGRSRILASLVGKIFAVKGVLALIASFAVVFLAGTLADLYKKPGLAAVLPAVAWMVLLEASFLTFRSALFGLQRFRTIWILALVNNVIKMVMVGLVALLGAGIVGLAWGLIGVVGITTILAGGILIRVLRSETAGSEGDAAPGFPQIWTYVLPLLGARSFFLAGQHLNKVILGAFLGARELGLISFALVTAERFVGFAHALPLSFLPSMSRLKGLGDHAGIERILAAGFRVTSALALVLATGLLTLGREIIVILGGFEYLPVLPAFQILALVYLFRTLSQPLTMTFYTFERTKVVFWLALLKLVVELGLYPVLIPVMGITGVAVAVIASALAGLLPSLAVVNGIFPSTAASRQSVVLRVWLVGGLLIGCAAAAQSFVPLVWPSLIVRLNVLLLGLPAGIILSRLIRSEDFARLRDEIKAPVPQKLLGGMEAVLQRAEGVLGGPG